MRVPRAFMIAGAAHTQKNTTFLTQRGFGTSILGYVGLAKLDGGVPGVKVTTSSATSAQLNNRVQVCGVCTLFPPVDAHV